MKKIIKGMPDWVDPLNENFTEVENSKTNILNTIGSDNLTTNAKNIKGAINEVASKLYQKANELDVSTQIPSPIAETLGKLARGENVGIIITGDSVTFGEIHTDAEHTYVAYLCRLIASKYPNSTVIRKDGQVVGTSIGSYNSITVQTGTNGQIITVLRNGVGGDTVLRVQQRLQDSLHVPFPPAIITPPDCIIMMMGINDSLHQDNRFSPPNRYKSGYEALIHNLKKETNAEIVLMTPTYNDDGTSLISSLDVYAQAVRELAISEDVGLVDLHKLYMQHLIVGTDIYGQGDWLAGNGDYCHPTASASNAIANEIYRILFANDKVNNITKINARRYIDKDDISIRYDVGWNAQTHTTSVNSAYVFSEIETSVFSATATLNFTGNKIWIRTRKSRNLGTLEYEIDGIPYTNYIDLYAQYPLVQSSGIDDESSSYFGEKILLADNLSEGFHKLTVKKHSNDGKPISIIGFEIENKTQNLSNSISIPIKVDLLNNWSEVSAVASVFYKDNNKVFLQGVIKSGDLLTPMFTLPNGFRPLRDLFFPVLSNDVLGTVKVTIDGNVILTIGNNAWVSLTGINFRIDC